jgi:hypothetical protein
MIGPAGAAPRPGHPAAAQCHQAPFMYEMKGALLCPQPVRTIPLVIGTSVEIIHNLAHRLSTLGQE